MRASLEQRANYVSREEYERAYALIEGAEQAKMTVAQVFDGLERNPDDHIVLDPKFIALLALFCESGRQLAAALLEPAEVKTLQQELAREFAGVREAFPDITTRY